jgi:large subunit ribosomal protein L35
MPKQKTKSAAKKRFKVSATGKISLRRRRRTTPPGHLIKSRPGKRKRGQQDSQVAPSDVREVSKLLGRGS